VILGLNPDRACLDFQGRDGIFACEIRERGSYSAWAATLPLSRRGGSRVNGRNRYAWSRLRFARDWLEVQGGLTTSMELTANKRPFLYFPLRHHFEQNFHVRHRLERYRAGRRMDYDDSPPEQIAAAIAQEIVREVDYRDVESDGARLAAQHIAELLN
jgi:hypothetical protein